MTDRQQAEYRDAVSACVMCAQILLMHDIRGMLDAIDKADAVGPLLDPTLWIKKNQAMAEDRKILLAALPLRNLADMLSARGGPQ